MRPPTPPDAEIERGLAEWEAVPASRDSRHPELADDFWVERTPEPLDLDRLTGHLRGHVTSDFERLLPVLTPGFGQPDVNEALQAVQLNRQAVADLDVSLTVRKAKLIGEDRLFIKTDEEPHGRLAVEYGVLLHEQEVGLHHVLALDFLSQAVRRDVSGDSVRYFFEPEGRYLAANDGFMPDGVDDLGGLFRATAEYFQVVQENLHEYRPEVRRRLGPIGDGEDRRERLLEQVRRDLSEDPEVADLVFAPFSMRGLRERLKDGDENLVRLAAERSEFFRYAKWHDGRPLTEVDPQDRFQAFDEAVVLYSRDWLSDFMTAEDPVPDRSYRTAYSELLDVRLIYDPDGGTEPLDLVSEMHVELLSHLAKEAAMADPPEIKAAFQLFTMFAEDPHRRHQPALYDMIRRVGPYRTAAILNRTNLDLGVPEDLLHGYETLRRTGWPLHELSDREIGEHLFKAHLIAETGLMRYLGKGDPELERLRAAPVEVPWEERQRAQQARWQELYDRADTIIERIRSWTGESVRPELRVDVERFRNRWELVDYDLPARSDRDVLDALMGRHQEVVRWMIAYNTRREDPAGRWSPEHARTWRSFLISKLVDAIEAGYDPRMVAIVPDANDHILRLMTGHVDDHHETAAAHRLAERWPADLDEHVTVDETMLVLRTADQLLPEFGEFPLGRLADWRASRDPEWRELLGEPGTYKELQFELALTHGWNEPVRHQVKRAIRLAGRRDVDRLYRIARQRDERTAMDLASAWAATDSDLPRAALRGVLSSLRTYEDLVNVNGWLDTYRAEADPLTGEFGPPRSFRALQSRMSAHPDDIRLVAETFSEDSAWRQAIEAPGFDFGSLYDFIKHPEFGRLMNGELNREQPFPYRHKYYFDRPLHECVSAALGSLRQGVPGEAPQPKKLYHDLKQFLKRRGSPLDVADLAAREIPAELESGVLNILRNHEPRPGRLVECSLAQLHMKSDPLGWVSGNYTDCCIPFGRTLNNDYMTSPATQYFTIAMGGRIVAQSVVVDAIDRRTGKRAVVLDSVEIANNYRDEQGEIQRIYRDFWDRFFPNRELLVGGASADPMLGARERVDAARYRPTAPLDYADAWRFEMRRVRRATAPAPPANYILSPPA